LKTASGFYGRTWQLMSDENDPPIDLPMPTEFEMNVIRSLERLEKSVSTLQLQVEELALILQQQSDGAPRRKK
jgi:hypothetical protein